MLIRLLLGIVLIAALVSFNPVHGLEPPQTRVELLPPPVPQDPSAVGYLNLHKRHPDAAEGMVEFNTLYSAPAALQRLGQIEDFLASFAVLTNRVRNQISPTELSAIGNTARDMQTIGFHNIPLIVEGTLLKQDYELKHAKYELARLRHAGHEISVSELERARREYADATKRFQDFWDKKLPTD
jgi:hypothetical protein